MGQPKQRFSRTKSVAPDDDPAFLRDLAEKLEAQEEKKPDETKPQPTQEDKHEEDSGSGPEPKDSK
jgi:hypothetical protein